MLWDVKLQDVFNVGLLMLWNVLSLGGFVMGRFVLASLYVCRKCNQLWSQLVAYLFIGTWEFTNSRKATTQVIKIA